MSNNSNNGIKIFLMIVFLFGLYIVQVVIRDRKEGERLLKEAESEQSTRDLNTRMERPICSECGKQYYEEDAQVFHTNDGQTHKICGKSECYGNFMARRVQENSRY